MKRLIINSTALLTPLTGVGRYNYEIAKRIAKEDVNAEITYYYGYNSDKLMVAGGGDDGETAAPPAITNAIIKNPLLKRIARRLLRVLPKANPKPFDLYWEPNNVLNTAIKAKRVLFTLHDLSVIRYPEWHPKERVEYFNQYIAESIERADMIITDSDYIRDEVSEYFSVDKGRITSIPLGYDTKIFHDRKADTEGERVRKQYTDGRRYMLFAGSVEPRKNLLNLLKAYNAMPDDYKNEFYLLLAGFSGWENEDIMALIEQNKESIKYAGYVDYEELGALYRCASLFAYPSFYEGFGLPPLEAMACGCPVVVSPVSSLPQVCGDAVQYVDPEDFGSIRDAMVKVLSDDALSSKMSADGIIQSKKFCWDKAAAAHAECMKKLL